MNLDKPTESFTGTIVAFNAADGLGDILLEDGQMVRFNLRACGPMKPEPGLKILVHHLTPGFGGKLRAGRVRPLTSRPVEAIRVWPEPWTDLEEGAHWEPCDRAFVRFDPEAIFAAHSTWVDNERLRDLLLPVGDVASVAVATPPPVFTPWEAQIADTSATALQLMFTAETATAGPSRVFAKKVLLEAEWPTCTRCHDPLEVVLYLHGADFPVIGDGNTYFAAFLCTVCCDEVALGEALWRFEHGVAQHPCAPPARIRSPKIEMPVERAVLSTPVRSFPDPRTLEAIPGVASEVLAVVVRQERAQDPRFPRAPVENRERADSAYRQWLRVTGERSQFGGFLNWRRGLDGEHPNCAHCGSAMRLLCALSEEDSEMSLGDDVGGTLYFFFCNRSVGCGSFRDVRVVHQFM